MAGHTPETSHPLALELASLRSSLNRFQHVSHKTSMQLQGKIMELTLSKETERRVVEENKVLIEELEVLRRPVEGLDGQGFLGQGSSSAGLSSTPTAGTSSSSSALAELTLAHRRLSSKLDISEESHLATSRSLADARAEIEFLRRERDKKEELVEWWKERVGKFQGQEALERGRRVWLEEDVKICERALHQAGLNTSKQLPPTSSPLPSSVLAPDDLLSPPASEPSNPLLGSFGGQSMERYLYEVSNGKPDGEQSKSVSEGALQHNMQSVADVATTPSVTLQSRRALADSFSTFRTQLSTSETESARLTIRIEELEATIDVLHRLASTEREKRVQAESEVGKMRADDRSAGMVVERYMAFTQKTSKQLHAHLQAQTTRLNQTIGTLRYQLLTSQRSLALEVGRTTQLRGAMDELAEGFERETFGRRREIGLRIKAVEREERRCDEARRWMEKVRSERGRLSAVSMSNGNGSGRLGNGTPTKPPFYFRSNSSSSSLASSSNGNLPGLSMSPSSHSLSHAQSAEAQMTFLWDLLESGLHLYSGMDDPSELRRVLRPRPQEPGSVDPDQPILPDSSTGRVILAEGMVSALADDLEVQTKRRLELERRLAAGLAGVEAVPMDVPRATHTSETNHLLVPEEELTEIKTDNIDGDTEASRPAERSAPSMESSPSYPGGSLPRPPEEEELFNGGAEEMDATDSGSLPEVKRLLLQLAALPTTRYAELQKALHDCAASIDKLRRQSSKDDQIDEDQQASLGMLLDGVHDVIEDVRVEVEIAITDDERVAKGFQTLLSVTPTEAAIAKSRAFVIGEGQEAKRLHSLERRLGDVEHDLVEMKVAALAVQSGESTVGLYEGQTDSDPFARLTLRTVKAPSRHRQAKHVGLGASNGLQRGFFGGLGRTFSGTTPNAPLGHTSNMPAYLPRTHSLGSPAKQAPAFTYNPVGSEDDVE